MQIREHCVNVKLLRSGNKPTSYFGTQSRVLVISAYVHKKSSWNSQQSLTFMNNSWMSTSQMKTSMNIKRKYKPTSQQIQEQCINIGSLNVIIRNQAELLKRKANSQQSLPFMNYSRISTRKMKTSMNFKRTYKPTSMQIQEQYVDV
jgi:hypothetical protein